MSVDKSLTQIWSYSKNIIKEIFVLIVVVKDLKMKLDMITNPTAFRWEKGGENEGYNGE